MLSAVGISVAYSREVVRSSPRGFGLKGYAWPTDPVDRLVRLLEQCVEEDRLERRRERQWKKNPVALTEREKESPSSYPGEFTTISRFPRMIARH